jgi:hypothetical protein
MLVDPDERAIDEDIFEIEIVAERFENALPDAFLRPAPEARINGEPLAERFRRITPASRYAQSNEGLDNRRLSRALPPGSPTLPTDAARSVPILRRSTPIESKLPPNFSALNQVSSGMELPVCKQALESETRTVSRRENIGFGAHGLG